MNTQVKWTMKLTGSGTDAHYALIDHHGNELPGLISVNQVGGGINEDQIYEIKLAVNICCDDKKEANCRMNLVNDRISKRPRQPTRIPVMNGRPFVDFSDNN